MASYYSLTDIGKKCKIGMILNSVLGQVGIVCENFPHAGGIIFFAYIKV